MTTGIFKELDLKSISSEKIFKTLLSSGTSGSMQSKIYFDKENATSQRHALSKIVSHFIGKNRLPMLIVNKDINFEKNKFDAKSAAIRGFQFW